MIAPNSLHTQNNSFMKYIYLSSLLFCIIIACRTDLLEFSLPEIRISKPEVFRVDSLYLTAEINSVSEGFLKFEEDFEIITQGFLLTINQEDIIGTIIPGKFTKDSKEFIAVTGMLGVDTSLWVKAFVEYKNKSNNTLSNVFSGALSFKTNEILLNSSIASINRGVLFINGSISGLDGALIQEYGHLWEISAEEIEIEELSRNMKIGNHPTEKISSNFNLKEDLLFEDVISISDNILGGNVYARLYVKYQDTILYSAVKTKTFADFWDEVQLVGRAIIPPSLAEGVGFAIGDFGYIGTGERVNPDGSLNHTNEFWKYNSIEKNWQKLEGAFQYPGEPRKNAVAFVWKDKAYVGLGWNEQSWGYYDDFYEFSPDSGWRKIANYPEMLKGSVAFVVNQRPIVGSGEYEGDLSADFYELSFEDNTLLDEFNRPIGRWIQKGSLPEGEGRRFAMGTAVGNYGYLIGGFDYTFNSRDKVFRFDLSESTNGTDILGNSIGQWRKLKEWRNTYRESGIIFNLNDRVYFGAGADPNAFDISEAEYFDFWELDLTTFERIDKSQIGEIPISAAATFSINGFGYIYGGYREPTGFKEANRNGDFIIYSPE